MIARRFPLGYLFAAAWAIFALAPLLWLVMLSFKPQEEWTAFPPTLLPIHPTVGNYVQAVADSPVPRFFLNSVLATGGGLALAMGVGVPAGYIFARYTFRFRESAFLAFLSVRMIPPVMTIIPLYVIMARLQLLDTYWALILTYAAVGTPVVVWVMRGFFEAIPKELEEAAMIDGATRFQAFRKIILPLTAPGLAAAAILVFVRAWNEYILALVLTSSQEMRTLPVGIQITMSPHRTDFGPMAAYSVIATLPIVLLFLILQGRFVSGLTGGAVKG